MLILGAILWDVRGAATQRFPTAARDIPAGTMIDDTAVAWIHLPAGLLSVVDPMGSAASTDIDAGDLLVSSLLGSPVGAPPGWWMVPIAIGTLAAPGDEALLVVADPPLSVVGIVIEAQVGDPYDLDHRPAAVAVPPDAAPLVAAAEQEGLLVAAIRQSTAER